MSRPDVKWGGLVFTWDGDAYVAALGTGLVMLAPCGDGWTATVETASDSVPVTHTSDDEVTALEAAFWTAARRHEDALRRIREVLGEVER